jgi:hypothetical protein
MLHRIIRYSVNEFAYNEGLIGRYAGFVISREDCIWALCNRKGGNCQKNKIFIYMPNMIFILKYIQNNMFKNKNGYIYLNCCDFGWWFMGFESIPH